MNGLFSGIPDHWTIERVDRVASVHARIGWKALTADEYQPEGYVFLSTPNIKEKEIDFENVNYISEFRYEESPDLKLAVGDVLLVKDGNTLGITNIVRELPRPATVNGSIAVLRSFGVHPDFLRYVIASPPVQGHISMLKAGMGVPHLFQWDIKRLPIPLPPLEEQRRIADFLDAETRGIDRLSGLISRQLDLLEERRQWTLDEVWRRAGRAQWKKLGYATLLVTSGPRGWGGYLDDDGEIFFRSANLNRRSLVPDLSDVAYVRLPAEARVEAVRSRISSGDVLVGITGANSGWVALADASVSGGYVSQHVSLVRPDSRILDGRWLGYMIASSVVQSELMGSQYGGTKTQLSLPDIRNIRIPDIPLEEQRRLVREVERTEELINRQKSLRKKQLSLLAERRQALITAAVTGQIDVTTARGADLS